MAHIHRHHTSTVFIIAFSLLCVIVSSSGVVSLRGEWNGMGPLVWRIESRNGLFLLKYASNVSTNIIQAQILIRDGMYINQGSYTMSAFGIYNTTTRTAVLIDPYSVMQRTNALTKIDVHTAKNLRHFLHHFNVDIRGDFCRYIIRFNTSKESVKGTFISKNCYASLRFTANNSNIVKQKVKSCHYTIFISTICIIQTIATLIQMRGKWTTDRANTISLITLIMLLIIPLYTSAIHFGLALSNHSNYIWYSITAALALICTCTYVSWIFSIWEARCSDRPRAKVMVEKASFILMLSASFGLFLYTAPLFTDYSSAAIIATFSFFLPQIVANVKSELHPIFVTITAIMYVAVPSYLWGCPRNFFAFHPRPVPVVILIIWIIAQAVTLIVQYMRQSRSADYTTLSAYS